MEIMKASVVLTFPLWEGQVLCFRKLMRIRAKVLQPDEMLEL